MRMSYEIRGVSENTEIVIQRGAADRFGDYIDKKGAVKAAVITDDNVFELYADKIKKALEQAGLETYIYAFGAGEASKNLNTISDIYDFLSDSGITRTDIVAALGGGVPGDTAGFAAATYLRGVRLIQIPTTLLACTDSSIGGKTGVDLPSGKNRAGAFYNPELVLIDPDMLITLPLRERACGMAEIIKYGCIKSAELIEILDRDSPDIDKAIEISCRIKCELVEKDPFDRNIRKLLNFGHTLGHAYEKRAVYSCSHGQAVAWGICSVLKASMIICGLKEKEAELILAVLKRHGLSIQPPMKAREVLDEVVFDKKMEYGLINLVLLKSIGEAEIVKMTIDELKDYL